MIEGNLSHKCTEYWPGLALLMWPISLGEKGPSVAMSRGMQCCLVWNGYLAHTDKTLGQNSMNCNFSKVLHKTRRWGPTPIIATTQKPNTIFTFPKRRIVSSSRLLLA